MRAPAALLLLCLSFALTACGSDGGEADEREARAEIRRMLVVSAKSDDPSACRRYSTQRALEQTWRERGSRALELCEEAAGELHDEVRRVDVSEIEVDGDRATAHVGFVGGESDGQVLEVVVADEDGRWKVDAVKRFVTMNRAKLVATLAREWRRDTELPIVMEVGECVLRRLVEADRAELEQFTLHSDAAEIERFMLDCLRYSEADQSA